jgi:hypothetical protein
MDLPVRGELPVGRSNTAEYGSLSLPRYAHPESFAKPMRGPAGPSSFLLLYFIRRHPPLRLIRMVSTVVVDGRRLVSPMGTNRPLMESRPTFRVRITDPFRP